MLVEVVQRRERRQLCSLLSTRIGVGLKSADALLVGGAHCCDSRLEPLLFLRSGWRLRPNRERRPVRHLPAVVFDETACQVIERGAHVVHRVSNEQAPPLIGRRGIEPEMEDPPGAPCKQIYLRNRVGLEWDVLRLDVPARDRGLNLIQKFFGPLKL